MEFLCIFVTVLTISPPRAEILQSALEHARPQCSASAQSIKRRASGRRRNHHSTRDREGPIRRGHHARCGERQFFQYHHHANVSVATWQDERVSSARSPRGVPPDRISTLFQVSLKFAFSESSVDVFRAYSHAPRTLNIALRGSWSGSSEQDEGRACPRGLSSSHARVRFEVPVVQIMDPPSRAEFLRDRRLQTSHDQLASEPRRLVLAVRRLLQGPGVCAPVAVRASVAGQSSRWRVRGGMCWTCSSSFRDGSSPSVALTLGRRCSACAAVRGLLAIDGRPGNACCCDGSPYMSTPIVTSSRTG